MFLYRISSQSNISCVDVDANAGIGDSINYSIVKECKRYSGMEQDKIRLRSVRQDKIRQDDIGSGEDRYTK